MIWFFELICIVLTLLKNNSSLKRGLPVQLYLCSKQLRECQLYSELCSGSHQGRGGIKMNECTCSVKTRSYASWYFKRFLRQIAAGVPCELTHILTTQIARYNLHLSTVWLRTNCITKSKSFSMVLAKCCVNSKTFT